MGKRQQPEPSTAAGPAYVIDGKRYPLVAIDAADLWDIIEIKKQTGLTVAQLERCLTDISRVGKDGSPFAEEADVFGSEEHLMALGVQMWLARRAVGEELTIREASSVPLGQWNIVGGDEEEPEVDGDEQDPTGLTAGDDEASGSQPD